MRKLIKRLLKEGLVNEKSLSDVSLHDFNIKGITQDWLMSNTESVIGTFTYEMQDDYSLSADEKLELFDKDDDEIMNMDRFKKWITYEVEYRIDDFIRSIDGYFNDGTITIWREMTVTMEWVKALQTSGKRLGRFWSWDEDAAEAHWGDRGNGKIPIKIQTSVREEYVDWNQTIEANIDLNIGEDEKEITLFKNTPIKIEALWVDGKSIDINPIKHKMFKA